MKKLISLGITITLTVTMLTAFQSVGKEDQTMTKDEVIQLVDEYKQSLIPKQVQLLKLHNGNK